MGFLWGLRLTAFAAALSVTGGIALAQQANDEGKRKIKSRMNPQCSELARRMNVTGKVKLEVVVAPDGHVKSTRALGGHPLLVQSSLDVVRDWKYEPGPEETTQVVEFDFKCQ
jgi:TonB family protein